MYFATKYDRMEDHLTYASDSGVEEEILYEYDIDKKTGAKSLVPSGKTSIKDYIQSFKDSVDLNIMMERFKNGEVDIFNRREGFFADVTNVPTTYPEMFARVQAAENAFLSLDPETRALFNNSPSEFWATYGTDAFNEAVYGKTPEPEEIITSEKVPVVESEVSE